MDRIALVFVLLGCLFLGVAVWTGWAALNPPDAERAFMAVDEPFGVDALVGSGAFQHRESFSFQKVDASASKAGITALYVITSQACAPCVREVMSYSALLDREGFSGQAVENQIIVIDLDVRRAERFAKLAGFDSPVLFGAGAPYVEALQAFGEATAERQLLLVDRVRGRLFFRARLISGRTTPELEKREVLSAAKRALDALDR